MHQVGVGRSHRSCNHCKESSSQCWDEENEGRSGESDLKIKEEEFDEAKKRGVDKEVKKFSFLALFLIRIYQKYISPLTPPACRFYPTCSEYAIEAIKKYGVVLGVWKALRRLCKCHPFNNGGIDFP